MRLASLIDVNALWHVAVYSLVAAIGLVTAYGTGILALDRRRGRRALHRPAGRRPLGDDAEVAAARALRLYPSRLL
jgi:hypothetical protein